MSAGVQIFGFSTEAWENAKQEAIQAIDQISKEEDAAGRGILTALVVLKDGRIPAEGVWNTAADLGRDVRDKVACWVKEFERVLEECRHRPLAGK